MRLCASMLITLVALLFWGAPVNAQEIRFDDSDPAIMTLGNGVDYEVGFRKSNGSIAYIVDGSTDEYISLGSRYECLWGAVIPHGDPDFVGGCHFNAAEPNQFTYHWSQATSTLVLDYTPDPNASSQVMAQIVVRASNEPWFDMHLEVDNNWGQRLDYVLFPSDLVFSETEIEEALLPILPGVILEAAFFKQDRSYTARYPGYPGLFADYVSISSSKGRMAIYSLFEQGPIRPLVMGFIDDDAYIPDSTFYYHTFGAAIESTHTWTSPWVRIHVGQPPLETIAAYRGANDLDSFPSLAEKLGSRYEEVVRSPLLKADAVHLGLPFSQYAMLLEEVSAPGILHPVAFQPRGHDENYPDFVPPDSAWGTTDDFAAMFRDAQARGFLVMPYTNPTWWDDESPTLQNLPPPTTITDVSVLDDQGAAHYEYYGDHGGYVVSPHAPFVQERLTQLVNSMTGSLPSDLLFEDQIGARPWLFDFNPAAPNPMAYISGWLAHTRAYSDALLMTELGFDRLAAYEAGFHGSLLLPERFNFTADWWGTDTWRPYPLAPMMARDKTLFYQHDLAPETFTFDKATLSWNLAFGYMLSYDLAESSFGGGLESEWLDLVARFQSRVLARYADAMIIGFDELQQGVTQTLFEGYTVTVNWNQADGFFIGRNRLPPLGVQVTSANGDLVAGVFTHYNGEELSDGDHYLIVEQGPGKITIYQPIGDETSLTLDILSGWNSGDPIVVRAFTAADELIGQVPVMPSAQGFTFFYESEIAGQPVAYYQALRPHQLFLPLSAAGSNLSQSSHRRARSDR